MKKITIFLSLFLLAVSLLSCSFNKKVVQIPPSFQQNQQFKKSILHSLKRQYHKWKNTPYRKGGHSYQGIDCSGLVHRIFLEEFNMHLPRSTKQLQKIGATVTRKKKKSGDLLFFKTGWSSYHVAIYMEKGAFLHASTSHGVIISNLQEDYWKKRIFLVKRVAIY